MEIATSKSYLPLEQLLGIWWRLAISGSAILPFYYGDVHSDGPCGGPSHGGSCQPHLVDAEHLMAL